MWKDKQVTATMAVEWSSIHNTEWRNARSKYKSKPSLLVTTMNKKITRWKPPVEGQLKINVDASVFQGTNYFSLGLVMRDQNAQFLRGKYLRYTGAIMIFEAKIVGVQEALSWVKDMLVQNIVTESDALLVMNALQKNVTYQLEVGRILKVCRDELRERSSVRVLHVKKPISTVTHLMT